MKSRWSLEASVLSSSLSFQCAARRGSPTQSNRSGSVRGWGLLVRNAAPGPRAAPGQQVNPPTPLYSRAWIAGENAKPGLILHADGQQSVSRGRAPCLRFLPPCGPPRLPLTFFIELTFCARQGTRARRRAYPGWGEPPGPRSPGAARSRSRLSDLPTTSPGWPCAVIARAT